MHNRLCGFSLLAILLSLLPSPVKAQPTVSITLSVPISDAFPRLVAYLDVHGAQGEFLHGLGAGQVRVLEDGNSLQLLSLAQLNAGVQFVVAITPGPSLGKRDNQGVSRYEYVKEALRQWAKGRQGSTLDAWSLVITGGPSISHTPDPTQWLATLDSDQVDARSANPSLDTLVRAIDLAADPLARPGMGRAILWITPPPEAQWGKQLENFTTQAQRQGVAIFVWMVGSSAVTNTEAVKQLTKMVELTGGQFFTYTGEETLPDLETYLQPLRFIYRLEYQSTITKGGNHSLIAQVQVGAEQIETGPQSFEIEVMPPQPAFVAPPLQIERKLPPTDSRLATNGLPATGLSPSKYNLQVVFDFPDGHKRPVARTTLFVDGVAVDENTQPPFDWFTWQLQAYTTGGVHQLRARVTDILGLSGDSIEIPVVVSVEQPVTLNPGEALIRNIPLLSGLAVVITGAILFLVLVSGRRLYPRASGKPRRRGRKSDPVTQPVPVKNERKGNRTPGSNPIRSDLAREDPSSEPINAHMVRKPVITLIASPTKPLEEPHS